MGHYCYPVLNDYLINVSSTFEPSKIFSRQMSQLSLSYLIPMNRTKAYYNELAPLTECLCRLYSPDLEKAGKRCALSMIRSVFQTGSSDKIKACLDMRIPKHVIHFLQDTDNEVRKECLLTLLEISKGLQDEDFEIMGKSAANLKQEYSRRGFRKSAFDQHKAISMANQQEEVQDQDVPMTNQ
jgi:oligoendopeptidase F